MPNGDPRRGTSHLLFTCCLKVEIWTLTESEGCEKAVAPSDD